jgi:hypothetical protein
MNKDTNDWREIVSHYSKKPLKKNGKKNSPPTRVASIVVGALLAIATKATISGACLLGLQWVLARAYPAVGSLQGIMPFWVALLGGLFLNVLHASVTAGSATAGN